MSISYHGLSLNPPLNCSAPIIYPHPSNNPPADILPKYCPRNPDRVTPTRRRSSPPIERRSSPCRAHQSVIATDPGRREQYSERCYPPTDSSDNCRNTVPLAPKSWHVTMFPGKSLQLSESDAVSAHDAITGIASANLVVFLA
jgi:hypothetical protein